MVISEKIDGTNAAVVVFPDGEVMAGSRKRLITPEDDNFGFAAWVRDHQDELRELGPGRHNGEWWGSGIQRGYGLKEKRFSLFNVLRWCKPYLTPRYWLGEPDVREVPPVCCNVVPVLYLGQFSVDMVRVQKTLLSQNGSRVAPGYPRPEGVVIHHLKSGTLFKSIIEKTP